MVRVKICGNRNVEEALMAIHAGADAVGLIVGARYKTEDEIDTHIAGEILTAIPPYISSVLVTHSVSADDVLKIHQKVPTTTIQLQDNIAPHEITLIKKHLPNVKIIKSIHVTDITALENSQFLAPYVDALLLDSRTKDRIGGTGIVHNWNISRQIVSSVGQPVILAGGLRVDNVIEAIKLVKPFGVDVNSGLEFSDGSKDPQKVRDFICLCKKCDII
jgi:phosphoribosylanthranilate isomerase